MTMQDIVELYACRRKKRVLSLPRRSLNANLLLIFGTTNLFKIFFYPLLDVLPLNGLEYEYEKL